MEQLPHQYQVTVEGNPTDHLATCADNLPELTVAPPSQFDGPGDQWSPEALFMASLANCLVLSFRPRAQLHKLKWHHIRCESQGVLEKVGHKIRFTRVTSKITLTIAKDESKEKARQLLEKAEQACFISNSLSCQTQVSCEIVQNA